MNSKNISHNVLSGDAFWKVNKKMVQILGCHTAPILLAELVFCEKNWNAEWNGDGFHVQSQYLNDTLIMKDHTRRKATSLLEKHGLITVTSGGMPMRSYYEIHHERMLELMSGEPIKTKQNPVVRNSKDKYPVVRNSKHKRCEIQSTSGAKDALLSIQGRNKDKEIIKKGETGFPGESKGDKEKKLAELLIKAFNDHTGKRIQLTAVRQRQIKQTLAEHSVKKFIRAIHGMAADDWSIKRNEVRFDRLIQPGKRDANLDRFSEMKPVKEKQRSITDQIFAQMG